MSTAKEKKTTEIELYNYISKEQFFNELENYCISKENGAEVIPFHFEYDGETFTEDVHVQDFTADEFFAITTPDIFESIYRAYKLGFMRGSKTGLYKIRINGDTTL